MDKEWTGSISDDENIILCGDFNMHPGSVSYKAVTQRLIDTHTFNLVKNRQIYKRTWLGITCLDYIFMSPALKTENIIIPQTQLTDITSDHLPVIADIKAV